MLEIKLVYAQSGQHQQIYSLSVSKGTTVQKAIEISGLLKAYPEVHFDEKEGNKAAYEVGIWYKATSLNQVLKSGDRIEIYRPLRLSAMEARHARKQNAKALD